VHQYAQTVRMDADGQKRYSSRNETIGATGHVAIQKD